MALASPAQALASTAPIAFRIASTTIVKAQVRFYSTATGDAGSAMDAAAGGSRDLTVTFTSQIYEPPISQDTYQDTLVSAVNGGTQTCDGATYYEFGLSSLGATQLTFVASGGANPGGALSYRIILDAPEGG